MVFSCLHGFLLKWGRVQTLGIVSVSHGFWESFDCETQASSFYLAMSLSVHISYSQSCAMNPFRVFLGCFPIENGGGRPSKASLPPRFQVVGTWHLQACHHPLLWKLFLTFSSRTECWCRVPVPIMAGTGNTLPRVNRADVSVSGRPLKEACDH